MSLLVSQYIETCTRCHRCMDVCPVTKGTFTIEELNNASKQGTSVPKTIKEFAFNCVQCGKCVPVCPVNIQRDYMVRYVKHKLRDKKPKSYSRYILIKGPYRTGLARPLQKFFIGIKKITAYDLARFMETTPQKNAEVLFYPGCYMYSTKTIRQTLRLLDHIGCSYTVLGGVTSCCGAPYRLQGEFEQAERCLEVLHQKIKAINPHIVITACAECFEEIEHLKTTFGEKYEVLSVAQYLVRQKHRFPAVKIKGKIAIHDSCRFTKESPQGSAARDAIALFGEPVELPLKSPSSCCSQWNHGADPGNIARQAAYLSAVKNVAPSLACNCLTCYEELIKARTDVEIIDVLKLFEDALDAALPEEQKQ
jgi:fumarate reductase (CoM/CoB) subunit B